MTCRPTLTLVMLASSLAFSRDAAAQPRYHPPGPSTMPAPSIPGADRSNRAPNLNGGLSGSQTFGDVAPPVNPNADRTNVVPNLHGGLSGGGGLAPPPADGAMYRLGVWTRPVYLPPPSQGEVGLEITSVMPGGAAAQIQLDPGDIITRIGAYRIRSQADLVQALQTAGGATTIRLKNIRTGQFQDMYVWPQYK